jgi:hypothetical protein
MKNKVLVYLFLVFHISVFSQIKITWKDLAKVKFEDKFFPKYNQNFLSPTFSSEVKALEGKTLTISGYFLDLDPEGNMYVLSKGPMSACFFCGIGGPETAVELHFKKVPPFKTDDIISVTGILKLNTEDVEHFNYILSDCKAILVK